MENVKAGAFLRWAGSKRKLIYELKRYYPAKSARYVEPFAGSACLFFALRPNRAILGDINPDLISTYLEVKHRVEGVVSSLEPLHRSKRTYMRLRDQTSDKLSNAKRAARFIYLNRYCFNGLYRTNLAGKFNVPFGADATGQLPSGEVLKQASRCLRNTRLVCGDFEKTLAHVQSGDFVYMDPPFMTADRRVFKEYDRHDFSVGDLNRLRTIMDRLHRSRVKFLVSYADCDEVRMLGRGYCTERVRVRRNIAGFAKHREVVTEVLISNS